MEASGVRHLHPSGSTGSAEEPSFLGLLSDRHQRQVISSGRARHFSRAEVMLQIGHRADDVIVLLEGHAKLSAQRSGGQGVILGVAPPGSVLGAEAAIELRPYAAAAHALDEARAVVIPAHRFRALVSKEPAVGLALMRSLAAAKRAADRFHTEVASRDAAGRVAGRILELALRLGQQSPHGTCIENPLSQDELADWIGASRQTVVRALQALRAAGWVTTSRRTIVVHDAAALRRLAA